MGENFDAIDLDLAIITSSPSRFGWYISHLLPVTTMRECACMLDILVQVILKSIIDLWDIDNTGMFQQCPTYGCGWYQAHY